MDIRELDRRYGTAAIVVLAVMILALAATMAVASFLVAETDAGADRAGAGTAGSTVAFYCPMAIEATERCLGARRGIASMPIVGSAPCAKRIDSVAEILAECSAGTVSDEEAAAEIESIGLDCASTDGPIWI